MKRWTLYTAALVSMAAILTTIAPVATAADTAGMAVGEKDLTIVAHEDDDPEFACQPVARHRNTESRHLRDLPDIRLPGRRQPRVDRQSVPALGLGHFLGNRGRTGPDVRVRPPGWRRHGVGQR